MLKSMTGYGKGIFETSGKKYTIEVKSLNSKSIDINTKIPVFLKNKELSIRNQISGVLKGAKLTL